METKHSNVKQRTDSQICSHKVRISHSLSTSTPAASSSKTKRKMPLESKEKLASKKPKILKSKAKQEKSNNRKKSESIKRKRATVSDMYDDVEAKFSVLERAERVLSSLSDEFPSFIKCMLPSNVAHGFWLHLPKAFCDIYLPTCDTNIILVDEWGNEYKTSYLLERHGLSAGWRAFSISHRLLKGDILIFRLIEPCKLKVDIVRVNGRDVVHAALCLLKFDASENTRDPDLSRKDTRKRKSLVKFIEPYIHDVCKPEANVQDEGQSALDCCSPHIVDQAEHNSKDSGSEDFEGSDIANHPQSNEFCSSKTSFLCDHPRDGVACR